MKNNNNNNNIIVKNSEKNVSDNVITENNILDLLNAQSSFKTSERNNKEYNYSKIVSNLVALNRILNLRLSDENIEAIKADANNFINEKTKKQFATNVVYSVIKKTIRNNYRILMVQKSLSFKVNNTEKIISGKDLDMYKKEVTALIQ